MMTQLIVMNFVLRGVFTVESMRAVARLARRFPTVLLQEWSGTIHLVLLNALGAYEIGRELT